MKKATINKLESDMERLNASAERFSDYIRLLTTSTQLIESVRFLLVFFHCFFYLKNYVRHLKFDNAYITRHFVEIDANRRLTTRKNAILPLKRFETKSIFSPYQFYISKHQNPGMKLKFIINICLMTVLLLSIALDYLVFDFLGK